MEKRASHLLLAAGIVFGASLCLSQSLAADPSLDASVAGENDQLATNNEELETAYSPWNDELWRSAGPEMKAYICSHASHGPSWCSHNKESLTVYPAPVPEMFGPNFTADDIRWLRLVAEGDPADFSPDDVAFIERRANQQGDPKAMEILGFLHATGTAIGQDPVKAYRWYGRAYMAGELQVKPNMDLLWTTIDSEHRPAVAELQALFAKQP